MSKFDSYENELLNLVNESESFEQVDSLDEEIMLAKQAAENYLTDVTHSRSHAPAHILIHKYLSI